MTLLDFLINGSLKIPVEFDGMEERGRLLMIPGSKNKSDSKVDKGFLKNKRRYKVFYLRVTGTDPATVFRIKVVGHILASKKYVKFPLLPLNNAAHSKLFQQ